MQQAKEKGRSRKESNTVPIRDGKEGKMPRRMETTQVNKEKKKAM
ncbi:MAG: hypothetical protein ACLVJX_05580 [Merdibacter sp.]|uniref:Uncharacterized protein n=1 Tax=Amedibacillus dolichus TaxID=31971 RepID=A0ABT7UBI3_9FIRM|nr:hypothetical protein [Amedibacillus dolichus]MDM8156991.1 hypothetical protein [Amedibacillus dolichus]